MIKNHLPNLLTYFSYPISNAVTEELNSKIQTVKANARGYRHFSGFRNSILFYSDMPGYGFMNDYTDLRRTEKWSTRFQE